MELRATILGGVIAVAVMGAGAVQAASANDQSQSEQVWLNAHNAERASFGSTPLLWSDDLAVDARNWAKRLARENRLRHSPQDSRGGTGENLWMGTAGYFAPAQMIASFADEKQYFRAGTFPHVSRTGNWADVGHYTQIVWAGTRKVGCATARGAKFDVLVCRYWPAGNVVGTPIRPQSKTAA